MNNLYNVLDLLCFLEIPSALRKLFLKPTKDPNFNEAIDKIESFCVGHLHLVAFLYFFPQRQLDIQDKVLFLRTPGSFIGSKLSCEILEFSVR